MKESEIHVRVYNKLTLTFYSHGNNIPWRRHVTIFLILFSLSLRQKILNLDHYPIHFFDMLLLSMSPITYHALRGSDIDCLEAIIIKICLLPPHQSEMRTSKAESDRQIRLQLGMLKTLITISLLPSRLPSTQGNNLLLQAIIII